MEGRAFSRDSVCAKIQVWFNIVQKSDQNIQKTFPVVKPAKQSCLVGWEPPEEGWIQLQLDGSVLSPSGKAAAGGLLRNHTGKCLGAYVCNLGHCSITAAELRGALEGLKIAWREGYHKIQLSMDSTTAIKIIDKRFEDDHRHGSIAKQFNHLLNLQWDVRVSHGYREANLASDFLASKAHSFTFGTHPFNVYDKDLVHWIHHDVMGVSHERFYL
ncbi:unnamed protein product [Linum trigynum]|uniref:RNase H type-1 domain-containing protein n=1 Tax=Linum trigynum TaxID=586398 RepID=A0AAV2EMF2_9ROSI